MENCIAIRPIGLPKCKTDLEIWESEPDNKFPKSLDPRIRQYMTKVRQAMGTVK